MGFVKIINPNAQGIALTARTFIESLGIDFHSIRGQGYYGASVMSGVHTGVQTFNNRNGFISCAICALWLP